MSVPEGKRPRPWKRLERGPAQDYTILTVREDRVEDPRDGSAHPRVIIECPDWVNVLALTRQDEAVLVRQYRNGIGANTLELPGGMVDAGEEPGAAAARELEEETGFRPERVVSLGWVHPNPALQTNRCHSYLALGCVHVGELRPDAGEDIQVELHPAGELPRLVQRGEITHALVVSALYLAGLNR